MERLVRLHQRLEVLCQCGVDFHSYLHFEQVYKSVSVVLHHCFLANVCDLKEMVRELCLSSIYFCLTLFSLLSCLIKQAERGTSIWSFISLGLGFSRSMSDTESVTVLILQSKVIDLFDTACGDYKLHVI